MSRADKKIIAILVAYNAAGTLENFYHSFPKHLVDEIILIDDASVDNTFTLAQSLGIQSYRNPKNLGYGGNMKRAFSLAMANGADVIIDIHPDGEYRTSAIPAALQHIDRESELVLGNRFIHTMSPLENGMYLWKYIPIVLLNCIARFILQAPIDDFHQGFRVYSSELLRKINFQTNANNYLFSFQIIAQAVFQNARITQVPVETSYTGKKRGANLKHSIQYSLGTFWVLFLYLLARSGIVNKLFHDVSSNYSYQHKIK